MLASTGQIPCSRSQWAGARMRCTTGITASRSLALVLPSSALESRSSMICASHRREALMLTIAATTLLSHPNSKALPLAPLGAVQVGEGKRSGITIQELKDVLARDIGEGMYFVTGNLSPEVFDDNCRFIDPTNDVTGLSRYRKALSILFDPALSKVSVCQKGKGREGKGYIAVPACEGSLAEAKKRAKVVPI
ncbi:hypothetical protein DUNSADRAFT_12347 [Dunaliella salina]|uniref:Uncharacterized protein n=1 Tax=Dunaliella salina TaxID=3046 RepID=A0ABQ7GBG9_DUNSA|nr:hypothetical protein DUNSADRAFT_12347 [Dunaliella salina]|eukprot:KAF5831952.1 hypothetical protein DUNSADRAFT_12347 [Dunaliella salina]